MEFDGLQIDLENVVWGNTQMFFPISLVMIGSWLIDRESAHDTLKNIMTIPVSMPKLLGVKLLLTVMLTALLGIYSVGVTLFTGLGAGLPGLTGEVVLHGGVQIVTAALLLMSGRKKEMKPGKRKNGRGRAGSRRKS